MVARLTVIVCQAGTYSGATSDLEESLVAELMMTNGMDATMVGPLERIDPSDTDYLCIHSFNHSLAILSWLSLEQVQEHWSRLGLQGQAVSLGTLAEAKVSAVVNENTSSKRKIYHHQLTAASSLEDIVAQLKELWESRNVKTVSIAGMPLPSKSENLPTQPSLPLVREIRATDQAANPSIEPIQGAGLDTDSEASTQDEQIEDEVLDQLVDDFDALDL